MVPDARNTFMNNNQIGVAKLYIQKYIAKIATEITTTEFKTYQF